MVSIIPADVLAAFAVRASAGMILTTLQEFNYVNQRRDTEYVYCLSIKAFLLKSQAFRATEDVGLRSPHLAWRVWYFERKYCYPHQNPIWWPFSKMAAIVACSYLGK